MPENKSNAIAIVGSAIAGITLALALAVSILKAGAASGQSEARIESLETKMDTIIESIPLIQNDITAINTHLMYLRSNTGVATVNE